MALHAAIAKPNEPRVSVLADAIVRAFADLEHGAFIAYDDLRQVLFEDPQAPRGRKALVKAKKRMLAEFSKHLVNVPNKGYQIAYPNEHAAASKNETRKGIRKFRKALAIVVHTEIEALNSQERQQIEEQANRVRLQLALTKKLGRMKVLPSKAELQIPSGKQLAGLLRRSS